MANSSIVQVNPEERGLASQIQAFKKLKRPRLFNRNIVVNRMIFSRNNLELLLKQEDAHGNLMNEFELTLALDNEKVVAYLASIGPGGGGSNPPGVAKSPGGGQ